MSLYHQVRRKVRSCALAGLDKTINLWLMPSAIRRVQTPRSLLLHVRPGSTHCSKWFTRQRHLGLNRLGRGLKNKEKKQKRCTLRQKIWFKHKSSQLVSDPGLLQIPTMASGRPTFKSYVSKLLYRCKYMLICTVCVNIKTTNLRHLQQLFPWFPFTIQWPAMKYTRAHINTLIQQ